MNVNLHLIKRAFFNVIFLLFILNSTAQTKNTITGVITEATSGKPIPHVEVFISGTTIGTTTNKKGKFSLKVPFFPCTLVADHVSYDSFVKNIDGSEHEFQINLKPSLFAVQEIKVAGKNNRKQNLKFFYSRFIRENKKKIEVVNDSVLLFKSNRNEFIAYSREPLIIINRILGYRIKLSLISFRIYRTEFPGGREIPLKNKKGMEYGQISGYFYYKPIETNSLKEKLKYQRNRRKFYFGSDRHFLKSVYHNNVEEEGYEMQIYPKRKDLNGFKEYKNYANKNGGKNFLMDADSIKVTYKYGKDGYPFTYKTDKKSITYKSFYSETSKIYRKGNFFTIWENGTSPNLNFVIVGPLAPGTNFANQLPKDYSPY